MAQYRHTIQHHHLHMKTPVKLSHINLYHCDAFESDIFPGHPYAKIIFVQKGRGSLHYEDISIPAQTGSFIIMNPEREKFTFELHSEYADIAILGVENLCFLRHEVQNPQPFPVWDNSHGDCGLFFNKIIREITQKEIGYEDACNHYLELFLITLQRHADITCSSFLDDKFSRDCQMIKNYLDEHFSENITLDTLSERSGLNKYYLVHSFTKKYVRSPISYLNEKRIDESKKLLENTNYSIAEISRRIGFSSQSYFSQAFKKKTLMTPNEYRRSNRQSKS
ncbi:MAG: AraC family transcriptional regulator [Eubacteriales bacterium]|nr:AraC family transcriptional regulator [Eubacteriales bacterium]